MKARLPDPSSPVAPYIAAFLAHKRALNRRYDVEETALRLFDFYLVKAGVDSLAAMTPTIVDAFFLSRPRAQPRSFNHLVGVVRRLFDWMVEHEMLDHSPVTTALRRQTKSRIPYIFDLAAAQRLLDVARGLADNPHAPLRGATYATIRQGGYWRAGLPSAGLPSHEALSGVRQILDVESGVPAARFQHFGRRGRRPSQIRGHVATREERMQGACVGGFNFPRAQHGDDDHAHGHANPDADQDTKI